MTQIERVPSPQDFPVHSKEYWENLILGPVDFGSIKERIDAKQMRHRELPADEEINAMALSASQEYRLAH
jgi:hypothetical protein